MADLKRARAKRATRSAAARAPSDPEVVAFLRELDHPLKRDIEAVRQIVLGVSPEIREGIKWNGPSFRTTEYFATFFLRSKVSVQLIFHLGAKSKDGSTNGMQIADPAGLIQWLAKERGIVTIGAGKQIEANRAAFETIVRQWIRQAATLWNASERSR